MAAYTPATFAARWAAYTLDLALLAPLLVLAAWVPLVRAAHAVLDIRAAFAAALERAFVAGAFDLVALAGALRVDAVFLEVLQRGVAAVLGAAIAVGAITVLGLAAWFIAFESSPAAATPGKRLMRLRVATGDGCRAPTWRIALRFVAAGPSWLLLHLGHAMAAWRDDGRALHDGISGTRVLALAPPPRWMRVWLALQGALVVALFAFWIAGVARTLLLFGA